MTNGILRVGVIGANRRRNGTGPFVSRLLERAGATVISLACTTMQSACTAATNLARDLEHSVLAFDCVQQMCSSGLDAVAICSPAECHEAHLQVAQKFGLHTFCEKPLLWSGGGEGARAGRLISEFKRRGLVLKQNTQWAFLLSDIARLIGDGWSAARVHTVDISLAPPRKGLQMFFEAVPHAISIIGQLGATMPFSNVRTSWSDGGERLDIHFAARRQCLPALQVSIRLKWTPDQPRPASIAFDGRVIARQIVSLSPYRIALTMDGRCYEVPDPTYTSVVRFVRDCKAPFTTDSSEIENQLYMLESLWPLTRNSFHARYCVESPSQACYVL